MATASGLAPTTTVATTVFVAVAITDTVFEVTFVTYAKAPSGVTATAAGVTSTTTVATTVFVSVAITDTVFEVVFVTYANCPPEARVEAGLTNRIAIRKSRECQPSRTDFIDTA